MSDVITSVQNQRVKNAVKLRDRRGRQQQRRMIIDGSREILRAIQAGVQIMEIFVCPEQCDNDECGRVLEAATAGSVQLCEVSPRVFQKISFGDRAEGVVAVAETPQRNLADLSCEVGPLIVVLDGIEKPGNIGAIIRSADGAGVAAVLVVNGGTDVYNPNTIRASLGTIFSMRVCSTSADQAKQWLAERNVRIVAAHVDGAIDYDQCDFTGPTAIVLGSEAGGLSSTWRDETTTSVRLPMRGVADSLNVSATAAVLFYEALRQRRKA